MSRCRLGYDADFFLHASSVVAMAYAIGGISGCHINPARSIGPSLFEGGVALKQLWIFIVGPFVGGALAAGVWKFIGRD